MIGRRKVPFEAIVTSGVVLALALGGCGGDEEPAGARATPPAAVTPVPTGSAAPTPAQDDHGGGEADLEAAPTSAPDGAGTGGAQAGELPEGGGGDEAGNRVPVGVTITGDRVRADDDVVPAFLALRFTVVNETGRELQVAVLRSGEGGGTVGRSGVPAGERAVIDVDGQRPGSLEVLSPDLDPDETAIISVEPGAG